MTYYLADAIRKLKPNSEFSFQNEDYSTIKWDVLEGDAPTQSEIDEAIKLVKKEQEENLANKIAGRAALLERLGITEDEARLLLG